MRISRTLSDGQRRDLDERGFVILPDVLSGTECDLLSEAVDEVWARVRFVPTDNDEVGVRFVANLLAESALFERCVADAAVLDAVRHVLGADVRLNAITSRCADPGAGLQPLHSLRRRRGRPFFKVNTIWCLDEFTAHNGATRLVPGTHLSDEEFMARCVDPLLPDPHELRAIAPRGSVIVHNSQIIHGGTLNETAAPRRSVHAAFATPDVPARSDWTEVPQAIRAGLSARTLALLEI